MNRKVSLVLIIVFLPIIISVQPTEAGTITEINFSVTNAEKTIPIYSGSKALLNLEITFNEIPKEVKLYYNDWDYYQYYNLAEYNTEFLLDIYGIFMWINGSGSGKIIITDYGTTPGGGEFLLLNILGGLPVIMIIITIIPIALKKGNEKIFASLLITISWLVPFVDIKIKSISYLYSYIFVISGIVFKSPYSYPFKNGIQSYIFIYPVLPVITIIMAGIIKKLREKQIIKTKSVERAFSILGSILLIISPIIYLIRPRNSLPGASYYELASHYYFILSIVAGVIILNKTIKEMKLNKKIN